MQLITPFVPLLQGGMVLTLRLSAASGQNIQLDLLPHGKDSATGVALPARALVGSAQELEEHLEAYLQKYAASVLRVADLVAHADADLKAIEDAAAAEARRAVHSKGKPKPPTQAGRERAAGAPMQHEDADDDADDPPLLLPAAATAQASGAAAAGAGDAGGISRDLFVG